VEFIWPSLDAQYIGNTGYCYGLKNQLAILVDGSVIPCCLDGEGTIILGNIKDSSLQEIIDSPRAQAIYQGFANRKVIEPLCQRCNFRTRF
jgi:radical SAM protein with 4Fe4S-binding SPASM domain